MKIFVPDDSAPDDSADEPGDALSIDDARLAEAACAGSLNAWRELRARHEAPLCRSLAYQTGDPDAAEQLTRATLERAAERLGEHRSAVRFAAWLRGVAKEVVREGPHSATADEAVAGPDGASTAGRWRTGVLAEIVRREQRDLPLAAVAALPALYREAFVLRFIDGLADAEISSLTGAAAGATRVRAERAVEELRKQLGAPFEAWLAERNGPT